MRRILKNLGEAPITIDMVNDTHIIGVTLHSGSKATIIKIRDKEYILAVVGTNNSYDSKHIFRSINSIIEDFGTEHYIFNSKTEFLRWMLED